MRNLPPRWGKIDRNNGGAPAMHRLEYHMLDVAAVFEVLLERRPDLLRFLAASLRLQPEAARRLLAMLVALHDLGKVATSFQAMSPASCAELGLIPPYGLEKYTRENGHDRIGHAMLRELRRTLPAPLSQLSRTDLSNLSSIFCGHHGLMPRAGEDWLFFRSRRSVAQSDLDDALAYVEVFAGLYDPEARPLDLTGLDRVSYLLNGIVTVCDWLGSHERFAFQADEMPLETYRTRALATAAEIVSNVRPALFHRLSPPPPSSFTELFAHLAEDGAAIRPTWLQQAVDELFTIHRLPEGPLLVLIEDATGSGKTEAGDLVAQRLIALGRAHGLYAALPTTATADAAFMRKKAVIAKLYGHGADPQVTLAHGRATTREALRVRYKIRAEMEKGDPGCLEWTAQSSKRALLADIGIGTIDQALLGALRTRHATVRLAGLYGKLLLVDEVHAYDDYMQELLKRLLRHQASLGQHVVLMSATLPSRMRETLVAAFAKGTGWSDLPAYRIPRERYPALHVVHRDGVIHREPEQPPEYRPAPVRFEPVHDEASVVSRIVAWSKAGRCVLWVRNTVDEAVRAYDILQDRLGATANHVLLYHARFLPKDRAEAEAHVLNAIGKDSGPVQRRGSVVVTTQVAEQSLDLDADELVTDIAPIDVVLQRLGRRRRHRRDAEGARTSLDADARPPSPVLLHLPSFEVQGRAWLEDFSYGSAMVYPDHGRLWLSSFLLLHPDQLPDHPDNAVDPWADAKPLVEAIYDEDNVVRAKLPPLFHGPTNTAAGQAGAARQEGQRISLAFTNGLYRDWNQVDSSLPDTDEIATTRLGESHEHLLFTEVDGALRFLIPDEDPLEVSSVRYRQRLDGLIDDDPRRLRLLASLPSHRRRRVEPRPMLVMWPNDSGGWRTTARQDYKQYEIHYDRLRGLRVSRSDLAAR